MVIAIILSILCFAGISANYAKDIFDMCQHSNRSTALTYRFLAVGFAPLMPAFVLANYAYYLQKEYQAERELQTLETRCVRTSKLTKQNIDT